MILNIHSLRFFHQIYFPRTTESHRIIPSIWMQRERFPIGFYRLPKARASMRTCFAVRFYYQIHSGDKSWPFNGPINRAQCPITVLLITRPPIKMEKMKAKKKGFDYTYTFGSDTCWKIKLTISPLWLIEKDGEN